MVEKEVKNVNTNYEKSVKKILTTKTISAI